uniref:Uncharacterized protein n=1 Tax=Oryza meridionalis TaxID=40149 RepID=A0A0E0C9K1_9ORYZ
MAFRKSLSRSELIQLPCAASRRRGLCSMRRRRHGAPSAPSHEVGQSYNSLQNSVPMSNKDKYETSWQRLDYTNAKYDCLEQSYKHLHVDVDLRSVIGLSNTAFRKCLLPGIHNDSDVNELTRNLGWSDLTCVFLNRD